MVDYIVIQAGGKGTRMGKLTRNKPKALVPIDNLPMIFHLFRKYSDKKFIVIGGYKFDVLTRYLNTFATVNYNIVDSRQATGTCAGLRESLEYIPDGKSFMLIWCDLVLSENFIIPNGDNDVIGISKDFKCRWKYENCIFTEEKSTDQGVAGLFVFKNKEILCDVPDSGEFVRWLQSKKFTFLEQGLYNTHEYGMFDVWNSFEKTMRCRPFNKIIIENGKLYKTGIDQQGKSLAIREVAWYNKAKSLGFNYIPEIYEYEPLCMELINGKNIYDYGCESFEKKKEIITDIVNCLKSLHEKERVLSDIDSYKVAYIDKTFDRLKQIVNLVPFAKNDAIVINGKKCRNIFSCMDEVKKRIMSYFPASFCLIHGDCTFSNMMLKNDSIPILLDPRGYFGTTEIYGDVAYDWVKLYYSLLSNYDQFNLKHFELVINDDSVDLSIESNNWEDMKGVFLELVSDDVSEKQLNLLLAIIWLSLTTYAWEDYDSICGAFYNGLLYLEEALSE